jgi:hypothetical protein
LHRSPGAHTPWQHGWVIWPQALVPASFRGGSGVMMGGRFGSSSQPPLMQICPGTQAWHAAPAFPHRVNAWLPIGRQVPPSQHPSQVPGPQATSLGPHAAASHTASPAPITAAATLDPVEAIAWAMVLRDQLPGVLDPLW